MLELSACGLESPAAKANPGNMDRDTEMSTVLTGENIGLLLITL
jgi:hypothetical protein